jgi:hypothetical protein
MRLYDAARPRVNGGGARSSRFPARLDEVAVLGVASKVRDDVRAQGNDVKAPRADVVQRPCNELLAESVPRQPGVDLSVNQRDDAVASAAAARARAVAGSRSPCEPSCTATRGPRRLRADRSNGATPSGRLPPRHPAHHSANRPPATVRHDVRAVRREQRIEPSPSVSLAFVHTRSLLPERAEPGIQLVHVRPAPESF